MITALILVIAMTRSNDHYFESSVESYMFNMILDQLYEGIKDGTELERLFGGDQAIDGLYLNKYFNLRCEKHFNTKYIFTLITTLEVKKIMLKHRKFKTIDFQSISSDFLSGLKEILGTMIFLLIRYGFKEELKSYQYTALRELMDI